MQIILLETLNKLGKAGEVVSVKDGFAKNFLIPQKKAIIANKKNLSDLNSKMSQINENNMKKISEANELKAKLDGKEINIQMEANEDGNLYGNLGPRQIRDRLVNDFSIDIAQFKSLTSLLSWDQETYMPKGSIDFRSTQLSFLSKLQHDTHNSDDFVKA